MMDAASLAVYALISFAVSLVSGMLGLGGAILLIPAFLHVPPLVGLPGMDMKPISGLTSILVIFTSMTGVLAHGRHGVVDKRLVLLMGGTIAVASLIGALVSAAMHSNVLLAVFAGMALLASAVLFLPVKAELDIASREEYSFSRTGSVLVAGSVGFFGGMVGAPGAFLLVPLMIYLLKIPTRITIGSTFGIVLLSAAAASIGKLSTGQVPLPATVASIAGAIPGVLLGSRLSHSLPTGALRKTLGIIIVLVAAELWWRIMTH